MSSHICKETKKLLKLLIKQGCRINGGGQQFQLYSGKSKNIHTVHMGKRSYHNLRRWSLNEGYKIR